MPGREPRQISVRGERAVGFAPHHPAGVADGDEQAPVGKEPEARWMPVDVGDDLGRSGGRIEAMNVVRVHVGEPEPVVVPAWAFGKCQAGAYGVERGSRHGRTR